ncbi:hypothetical protein ULMS_02110 [Patiriisocius marinistellae]|uniref:Secretion system C-terminal sorting domain-containing protein n=1 Tax=Patiriisocius marinistellae TaxID=2494560 RepID=A0A5J4FT78_9FLAO|nr:T9SS type A sorting domain-containing protein [Patiriisocius marinistellae]GEQ84703.1 hypothetical protein ULMS_02110 [Patiriisocius marinistellae]
MKKITFIVSALLATSFVVQAQQMDEDTSSSTPPTSDGFSINDASVIGTEAVFYENGPYFNLPGAGLGGADISRLENVTIGNTTLGAGCNTGSGFRISDDFTIADGYQINEITLYAYQTGAPTSPASIPGVYIQIWDGIPSDPGSTVIYGDLATNVLDTSFFSNAYRDSEGTPDATDRAIQEVVALTPGLSLAPGQYWVDWVYDGDPGFSGPWQPPISILGATTTGDALQFDPNTSLWAPNADGGSGNINGFPFALDGDQVAGVFDNTLDSQISVSPNPASDILRINTSNGIQIEAVSVYDIKGSLVRTFEASGVVQEINVQDLSAGVFLVKIQTNQGQTAKRIVKK